MGKMPDNFDPLHLPPRNVRLEKNNDIVAIFFSRSRKLRYSDGTTELVGTTGKVKLPTGDSGMLDEKNMVLHMIFEKTNKQN